MGVSPELVEDSDRPAEEQAVAETGCEILTLSYVFSSNFSKTYVCGGLVG